MGEKTAEAGKLGHHRGHKPLIPHELFHPFLIENGILPPEVDAAVTHIADQPGAFVPFLSDVFEWGAIQTVDTSRRKPAGSGQLI